jgi:prolyl oligopeptidase
MRPFRGIVLLLALILPLRGQWAYPPTPKGAAADTYFGRTYPDPYRWLEDLQAQDTQAWFHAQSGLAEQVLAGIPGRDALVREWTSLDQRRPAYCTGTVERHGRLFYRKAQGGEPVGKLYCRQGWSGPERLLFDPAAYQAGVVTAMDCFIPSPDGSRVALGLTAGGCDYGEVRVLDVASGALLPDRVGPTLGPAGWTPDGRSFFYDAGRTADLHSPDFELDRGTRLHRLGTDPAADPDVFSAARDPGLGIDRREFATAYVDDDLPGQVVGELDTVQKEHRVYLAPLAGLAKGRLDWRPLCGHDDRLVQDLVFQGGQAYAITYAGAPDFKVVRTSLAHPDWSRAETVIPEQAAPIRSLVRCRHYLFAVCSDGLTASILRYDFRTGALVRLTPPCCGTVKLSCPDSGQDLCLATLTTWTRPPRHYLLDAGRGRFDACALDPEASGLGLDRLEVEEVQVPGRDGARIPLSIVHLRDLPRDGSHSCILEGYGAYGTCLVPAYSVVRSVALRGVVLAFAHVRGGSEKGQTWYQGGLKETKPNTWKDFIDCAEYLVQRGYTRPEHLAGTGSSAGGILISRAITERPDLFAAAVCNVGCANAMRLEFSPNGPVNVPEFGTVRDERECRSLYEMDGLQHVRDGVKYPAVLGVGGWNDSRVPAWQPGKFVAALQDASASGRPALMLTDFGGGHQAADKRAAFQDYASQYAFLLWQTGHPDFQSGTAAVAKF